MIYASFFLRIVRRLTYEFRKLSYRFSNFQSISRNLMPLSFELANSQGLYSLLPGDPKLLKLRGVRFNERWMREDIQRAVNALLQHTLPVLSSVPFSLSNDADLPSDGLLQRAKELPKEFVDRYRPIRWHTDFKSDITFPKDKWFFDSKLAPRIGVDVKIPWELSRFVHVGILAHADYERGGHEFILQVLDWIEENKRFCGINWSSELVVAVRAVNWIWGISFFDELLNRYPDARRQIISSIYDHYLYLQRHLAYHELYTDDHYLGDLVGLTYITCAFPQFKNSDRWLLFSIIGIEQEMYRQVLPDGYSHMMSTHYHRFTGEMFASSASLVERLPLERRQLLNMTRPASAWPYVSYASVDHRINLIGQIFSKRFYSKLSKMAYLTQSLTKPNGLVVQLGDNDSARLHRFFDSITADVRDHTSFVNLVKYITADTARTSFANNESKLIAGGLNLEHSESSLSIFQENSEFQIWKDSGIGLAKRGPFHLIVSCSPNGYMDGKGGHGHNDKLSFELNVLGLDFVVDGGCPYYTSHPKLRNAFRSTVAHSTLQIENLEQDPIPENLFSLPQNCKIMLEAKDKYIFLGNHDGFGPKHSRLFELENDLLRITDCLEDDRNTTLRFNLDPSVTDEIQFNGTIHTVFVKLQIVSDFFVTCEIYPVEKIVKRKGFFGVGYGQPVENKMIEVYSYSRKITTIFKVNQNGNNQ